MNNPIFNRRYAFIASVFIVTHFTLHIAAAYISTGPPPIGLIAILDGAAVGAAVLATRKA